MITILFVFAILMFIATFGIHSMINNGIETNKPMYLSTPFAMVPWVSGFILPVIPLSYMLEFHWLLIFIINFAFVYIAGPFISRAYLTRLSTGILGKDLLYTFGLGVIALIIGLIILE